jgi:hypothetical protein
MSHLTESQILIMDDYLKGQNIKKINLNQLKKRCIVPKNINQNDVIERTWLKGHPSIGKEDAVVWQFESIIDEIEFRNIYNIPFLHPLEN